MAEKMKERLRVLVTGGAGFVGSHVSKLLARRGYEPVTFDNLSRGHPSLVRYGPLISGDLHDCVALHKVIAEIRPVACLHFAAFAYVAESVADPALYYRNNVAGSLSLLEALVRTDVHNLVFSSTCAVYGQSELLPITEDMPKRPMSPYGRSKLMVEEMLHDFDLAYGLRSVSLRYFNAAGADPDGELGEMHYPEPHIIPRTLMAAAGLIPSLEVFGTDYRTHDGTAVRDYTHVTDIAQAHVAALEYLLEGGASDSFNLGVGQGYSVHDIIRSASQATGRNIPVVYQPRRQGDPAEVIAHPGKARRVLQFEPHHSELEEMVSSAWRWFERHGFRRE